MRGKGYISISREIQEHWVFEDARHFKWWSLILFQVSYKRNRLKVGNQFVTIEAGQSILSIRRWTALFNTTVTTTYRFLKLLESDGMITRQNINLGKRKKHILTVVNWAKWQGKVEHVEAPKNKGLQANKSNNMKHKVERSFDENVKHKVEHVKPAPTQVIQPENNGNMKHKTKHKVEHKVEPSINNINNNREEDLPPTLSLAPIKEIFKSKIVARGLALDSDLLAEKFYNHYEANGWKIGKNRLQNVDAAIEKWIISEKQNSAPPPAIYKLPKF